MKVRRIVSVSALGLGLLASGCSGSGSGDDGGSALVDEVTTSTTGPASGCEVDGAIDGEPATTVDVTLSEYAVALSRATVPAGAVELVARNDGRIAHEMSVVRFDGDPASIPVNVVGGADVTQLPDGALVGRIWSFDPEASCRGTFDLAPGTYALICNVVDDGTNPHYGLGMSTALTVT